MATSTSLSLSETPLDLFLSWREPFREVELGLGVCLGTEILTPNLARLKMEWEREIGGKMEKMRLGF